MRLNHMRSQAGYKRRPYSKHGRASIVAPNHLQQQFNVPCPNVWRRKPEPGVIIHSDQGSQYGSHDWLDFQKTHKFKPSMSRRGNCYDNAVAESFFQLLKRERIRRKVYTTRAEARADVFDYIEMFYNPKRRHSYTADLSPMAFEKQYFLKNGTV